MPNYPLCIRKPEPGAWEINAFPPFSNLGRVLAKVQQDGAILVTPSWSTQPRLPQLLEIVIEHPRLLKPGKDLVQLQGEARCGGPLHSKLVTIILGQPSNEPSSNMTAHCDDGESFVVQGKSIPLLLM